MNKEIIINIGVSGSGKTTWSTNFIKQNSNYVRINRDDIRKTLVGNLDGYYQRKDLRSLEDMVTQLHDYYWYWILECSSKNIIIDNTNLKFSYINPYIEYKSGNGNKIGIKYKLFDISLDQAKANVYTRENNINVNIQPVPKKYLEDSSVQYIDKQYQQYLQIKKEIQENYGEHIFY